MLDAVSSFTMSLLIRCIIAVYLKESHVLDVEHIANFYCDDRRCRSWTRERVVTRTRAAKIMISCELTTGVCSESLVHHCVAALMSAAYELVPTDESTTTADVRPKKVRHNYFSHFKALAILLAVCLVSLVSYKAGQWSVEHRPESPVHQPNPAPTEGDIDIEPAKPTPSGNTNMPGNGKYSVG